MRARNTKKRFANRQPRSGFETLENRQLFAADLDITLSDMDADMLVNTHSDDVASSSDSEFVASTISPGKISVELADRTLSITGSGHGDTVTIFDLGTHIQVEAGTYQLDGVTPYVRSFEADAVDAIYFYGYEGDDTFVDHTLETTFAHGGDGNDYLYASGDASKLYGDDHDDTLVAGPYGTVSLYGGDGNDTIDGNDYGNYINGGAGDDYIQADSGDDYVRGGSGDDTMYGHYGDDVMHGDEGDDYMNGYRGNDRMYGDDGRDFMDGHSGHDRMYGGKERDVLYGGYDNDFMRGGDGTDYIYGGWGNDRIFGDDGWDALWGEQGDDYLNGGKDGYFDYLVGGYGADEFERHASFVWWGIEFGGEKDDYRDLVASTGDKMV